MSDRNCRKVKSSFSKFELSITMIGAIKNAFICFEKEMKILPDY